MCVRVCLSVTYVFIFTLQLVLSFSIPFPKLMFFCNHKTTKKFHESKIMVKLELNLPWKPILAWPWGVKYTIDPETYLIIDHEESWDIGALDGVKQIFRKPTVQI